jgi:hypothetical protein
MRADFTTSRSIGTLSRPFVLLLSLELKFSISSQTNCMRFFRDVFAIKVLSAINICAMIRVKHGKRDKKREKHKSKM